MLIGILEDDVITAEVLQLHLHRLGHQTEHYGQGQAFCKALDIQSFELLIIDWMLPDTTGIEVLRFVRGHFHWHIPVLFVTLRDQPQDVCQALELGADDYLTKPVHPQVLGARIHAVTRRLAALSRDEILDFGNLQVDSERREIRIDGHVADLTERECDLALCMLKNVGRVLSRSYVLEQVWGRRPDMNTRTVDAHMSRIRHKLELNPERGWRLRAVYNHGYRLERLPADGGGNSNGIEETESPPAAPTVSAALTATLPHS